MTDWKKNGHTTGITGGLLDKKHSQQMREAVWLFMWFVDRQTGKDGRVLALKQSGITCAEIAGELGPSERTIRRWVKQLQRQKYITVEYAVYKRLAIYVVNPKKFHHRQGQMKFSDRPDFAVSIRPKMADKSSSTQSGQKWPIMPVSDRPDLAGLADTDGRSNKTGSLTSTTRSKPAQTPRGTSQVRLEQIRKIENRDRRMRFEAQARQTPAEVLVGRGPDAAGVGAQLNPVALAKIRALAGVAPSHGLSPPGAEP